MKEKFLKGSIALLVIAIVITGYYAFRLKEQYTNMNNNNYTEAFSNLVNYMNTVENYLAKSMISRSSEEATKTLTEIWKNSDLAIVYLSRIPLSQEGLSQTSRFLNQVSDYSYSLSRKNIYNEDLTEEDLKNLKDLHSYSVELENTLNQLSEDINSGRIKWSELTKNNNVAFAQQVSTSSLDGFSSLEENFHEYSGLIYDGAFSEHITNAEKKGLTGEDIDEETAKQKVIQFIGQENVTDISSLGYSENAIIPEYNFSVKTPEEDNITISISKKGGHIVYMNSNRSVNTEIISQDEANKKGKEFLTNHGYADMKETYYLKQDGIVTINYAYTQNNVVIYSDLIKVKIALDDGEVLGIETTGYLNNHTQRDVSKVKISQAEAKKTLNKNLEIGSEGLAIIPTEFQTEILCYEFKGKVEDKEFLVYINAENGREEDVLIITNTPNGILTM